MKHALICFAFTLTSSFASATILHYQGRGTVASTSGSSVCRVYVKKNDAGEIQAARVDGYYLKNDAKVEWDTVSLRFIDPEKQGAPLESCDLGGRSCIDSRQNKMTVQRTFGYSHVGVSHRRQEFVELQFKGDGTLLRASVNLRKSERQLLIPYRSTETIECNNLKLLGEITRPDVVYTLENAR